MRGGLGYGLNHADLVVDEHHCDEGHPIVELSLQIGEVEHPVGPDRQNGQVDAAAREPFAGVEHRRMLSRDRDNPVALG